MLCGAATIAYGSSTPAILGLGVMLACLETAVLMRRAGGFTATVFPVVIINGILIAAVPVWPTVAPLAIVSAQIGVSESDLLGVATLGMAFTAAYTVGALLIGPGSARGVSLANLAQLRLPTGMLVLASYAVLGITIVGYGDSLIEGSYLGGTGPTWAVILSNTLTPLAVIAVCVAAFRPGKARFFAVAGVVIWVLVLFGRSSRSLAALPAFLVLGLLMSSERRVRWWQIVIAAAATVFLLQLPLALRVNDAGVGILPLGETLLFHPDLVFANFDPSGVFGNILFSAPLAAVVSRQPIPIDAFWTSINPLPGGTVGWADLNPSLKLDASTPFNAIGELAAQGWQVLIIFAFVVGLAAAATERAAQALPGALGTLGMLLVMALLALYSVTVLQYNLRSSTRILWYAVFAVIILHFIGALIVKKNEAPLRYASRPVTYATPVESPSAAAGIR